MIRVHGVLSLASGWRWLWLSFYLAFLFACGPRRPEERLRLTRVESPVISPETPLELAGEGLPSGERLAVELRGVLAVPGRDLRTLEVSLVGHVLAPERLSIAIDSEMVRGWGRGSFEGEVRVSCEAGAARHCRGTLFGAGFDVEVPDARRSQQLRHEVERQWPALGMTVSDVESSAQGVVLSDVRAGSPAARAGLRAGDTLVRSNGVSLHALSDLAPGPGASALILRVLRSSGQVETVRLSLVSAPPLSDPRTLGLCLLACPALMLLLSRLSLPWPLPSPGATLAACGARMAVLRARADRPLGVWSFCCVLLVAGGAVLRPLPELFLVLALQLGCVLALRGARRSQLRELGWDVLGLWLAAASVAAMSGTRSWGVITHDQLGGPWAWNALSRPPLLFALLLGSLHAARLHAQPVSGFWALTVDRISRTLVAVLFAGLFLGAEPVAAGASAGQLVLGCAAAGAKALFCYALIAVLPAWPLPARRRGVLWSALLLASLIWPWLVPSRSFEILVGSVACVFAAFWCAVALWQARRAQLQPARPELRASAGAPG